MRKLIAAAAVLAVTSVHAEELKFGDINYFLKQGQFNVAADINSTYYKQTPKGSSTLETRGYLLETKYGYGINDKLNVYLGLDYAYDREVEDKTTASNADFTQDGLANPSLAANYRLMNQNEGRYNVDFGAVARINIEDSEIGDSAGQSSEDGNFADPRSSLELNARMGRKWNEANEWQFGVGGIYRNDGEQTLKDATGSDSDRDLDSSFDIFVRAAYQYRPVNEFMMSLIGEATRIGEVTSDVEGTDFDEDAHIDMKLQFRAKYLITDYMIANFHYSWSRLSEYDAEIGGTDVEIMRRRENFFGVGVDFLF